MTKIYLLALLLTVSIAGYTCSIFSYSDDTISYAAANEDGDNPFTYLWVLPAEKDKYAAVYLGYPDMQGQVGMNEHGLFYDFAWIPPFETNTAGKNNCLSVEQMLRKYRDVNEVLKAVKDGDVNITVSQMLIADASGNSAIINGSGVVHKKGNYLISTNFNICTKDQGYECSRYDKIDEMLRNPNAEMGVPYFQNILDRVHQEGQIATMYSTIFDLKNKKLHLNYFHDYDKTVVIDLAKEFKTPQAYVKRVNSYFSDFLFAEKIARITNNERFREELLSAFMNEGFKAGIQHYIELSDKYDSKSDELLSALKAIPFNLVKMARVKHDNTSMMFYYRKDSHYCNTVWSSDDEWIDIAIQVTEYIDANNLADEDFYYLEDKAYALMANGDYVKSINTFEMALTHVDKNDQWGKERVNNMMKSMRNL